MRQESPYADRSVPGYPVIREDGITPGGLGKAHRNQPCFCTEYNKALLYVPHSLTGEIEVARKIIEAFIPALKNFWTAPRDLYLVAMIGGREQRLMGRHAFSHILISKY